MATRNRLSMAGSGGSALLDTLDAFKRKHVSQNKDIIKRNMELMKLNTDLNARLRELQEQNMHLKSDNLKRTAQISQLDAALNRTKELLSVEKSRNAVLEGRGSDIGRHAEDLQELRQALTIIAAQAHQASLLLSQPAHINVQSRAVDGVEFNDQNTEEAQTAITEPKTISLDGPPVARMPLLSEPDLSFISEGSIEQDAAGRRWRQTTKIIRNPLAYSTSPPTSPPSSPEISRNVATHAPSEERKMAKRRQSMALTGIEPLRTAETSQKIDDLASNAVGKQDIRPDGKEKTSSDQSSTRTTKKRAHRSSAMVNLPLTANDIASPEQGVLDPSLEGADIDRVNPGSPQPSSSIEEQPPTKIKRRKRLSVLPQAADEVPPPFEPATSLLSDSLEEVESRAMRRISDLMQARKDAALALGRISPESESRRESLAEDKKKIEDSSTGIAKRRRVPSAMPRLAEESKENQKLEVHRSRNASRTPSPAPGLDAKEDASHKTQSLSASQAESEEENSALPAAVGRRSKKAVNYALPNLRDKMRQPEGYVPTIKKTAVRYSHSVTNSNVGQTLSANVSPIRPGSILDEDGKILSSLPRRKSSTALSAFSSPLSDRISSDQFSGAEEED